MDPSEDQVRPRPPAAGVYAVALLGSLGGIPLAMLEELRHFWLVTVLVGPAIEEICKPIALVFILDKRPHWLRSPREIVVLAALSAAVFATLENLLYVHVYGAEKGSGFVLWRYLVCTALHLTATYAFSLGLVKMWRHILSKGGHFDIDVCFRYYVAAVVIHAAYNTTVSILTWAGLLPF